MTGPVTETDLVDAIELYQSGTTITAAAASVGIRRERLKYHLGKRGLLRPQSHKLITDEIIAAYRAGEEYKSISTRTGISESVLKDRFNKLGVLRGRIVFEPTQEIFDRYTAGETATALARESNVSVNTLLRHLRVAGLARPISSREEAFAKFLRERGIAFEHPLTLGTYKIDFAFCEDRVAVEVDAEWGNRVRSSGRRLYEQRCEYILGSRWDLIEIRCRDGILPGAADYVVAYLKQTSGDPSTRGEYRVIGGNGQPLATGGNEVDDRPVVAAAKPSS